MRLISLLLGIFFFTFQPYAQRFGGNPSKQKWQQIDTDTVRIIFPPGNRIQAQRVAALIHQLQRQNANSLGNDLRKVSMLLQHRSLISNGYVGLAPFRSELYTTAPQDAFELGSADWVSNLAVHEFRHVQQYSNFDKGLSRLASVILGQEGQAVANAAGIPDWFFEGDAVYAETEFTQQGRGKLPKFFSGYQSLQKAGKQYSYMKLRNGSLRHYVPDHYALGYLLVSYGRKKYGTGIWQKITGDAASFKSLIYPFQGALKKYTGISFHQFVNDALSYYQEQWKANTDKEPDWVTTTEKHNVVNYRYPYLMEDGSVIALYDSYTNIPSFVKVSVEGTVDHLAVRDIAADPYFTYRNHKLVYTAYRPDARWGNVEMNMLKLLDLQTGVEQTLHKGGRLFSPDISADGKAILAADVHPTGGSSIVSVNVSTGAVDTIINDPLVVYSYPRFSEKEKGFYAVTRQLNGYMGIQWYPSTGTGGRDILLPASRVIGFLQVQSDTLLFSTTGNGRDELWAVVDQKENVKTYRLASYQTGVYQGAIRPDGRLLASVFTADGYRIASFQPLWQKAEWGNDLKPLYTGNLFNTAHFHFADSISQRVDSFQVKEYKKSTGLLNIHSWRPYYDRPEYSFTLYGENVLNTFASELAYTYNENEGSHRLNYDGVYGATYLQPLLGAGQTWQRSVRMNQDTLLQWNEWQAYVGFRLPYNFTRGKQFRNLTLQATLNRVTTRWTGVAKHLFKDASFNYIDLRMSYTGNIQRAVRQIFPRWGHVIQTRYRNVLGKNESWQMLVSGAVYLPGLWATHSLVLTGAIQGRDTMNQYIFSDNFPFSRGYRSVNFPRMYKVGLNYHFPVAYPDWGLGQLVYFQRVRLNGFYDHLVGKSLRTGRQFHFGAIGGELYFDTKWWNQEPVTFGLRYSRLLDRQFSGVTRPNFWEIILPVALFR